MGIRLRLSRFGTMASVSLAIISVAAFLTRLLPLSMSPFPFNNDSLTECRLANNILNTHHLEFSSSAPWYGTHSGAIPILNVILAYMSSALGVTPLQCAQVLDAVVIVLTVGSLFLVVRLISGNLRGAVATGLSAVLLGTFVFTTGSAWKEMLGISLMTFALLAYVRRERMELRVLMFVILMMMPFVHHLVAAVTMLTFTYLLTWSWYFALANGSSKKRLMEDTLTILPPTVWMGVYYVSIGFDKASIISSPVKMSLLFISFGLISTVTVMILSLKRHYRWTFAPFVGMGLFALFVLDYFGFIFPYSSSAPAVYLVLGAAFAFLVALAWYGSEVILERKPLYRAIQVALLVSPISIIGFGILDGFSISSHQIVYRTFDFLDIFIFIGIGMGIVYLYENHRKAYRILGAVMILALLASFPFAYMSQDLLGVRHDTQAYEVDATTWIAEHSSSSWLASDERLCYIGQSMAGLPTHAFLPGDLRDNISLSPQVFCLVEDSWMSRGVNDYPNGKVVLPESNYTFKIEAANVFYIGGPSGDRAVVFFTSYMGERTVYSLNR